MDHITQKRKTAYLVGVEKGSIVEWRWGMNHRFFHKFLVIMEKGVSK